MGVRRPASQTQPSAVKHLTLALRLLPFALALWVGWRRK